MNRSAPRCLLLAAAIAALAACSDRAGSTVAAQAADTSTPAILVATGPDTPMDSLRTADVRDVRDDPAELAARLRDAQLPGTPAPERVAGSR